MIKDAQGDFLRRQLSHSFVSFSLPEPIGPVAGKMDAVSIFSNLATAGALSALLTAVVFVDICFGAAARKWLPLNLPSVKGWRASVFKIGKNTAMKSAT